MFIDHAEKPFGDQRSNLAVPVIEEGLPTMFHSEHSLAGRKNASGIQLTSQRGRFRRSQKYPPTEGIGASLRGFQRLIHVVQDLYARRALFCVADQQLQDRGTYFTDLPTKDE